MRTPAAPAATPTLADIWRELQEQRVLLEQLLTRRLTPLTRADYALLVRLMPVVGAHFASEWFLVRELFASPAPGLRLVLAGLNARQVGRLLRRSEGQPVDGYVVERGASELHTTLWRVMQVDSRE